MANDSFNETMSALEKEKKTKQLANMLAAQEDISYDKAYQRAQKYIEAGIERPYLGQIHSDLNGLINNSCLAPGEEREPRKIKNNIKKSLSSKNYFKRAFTMAVAVAVIAASTIVISEGIENMKNAKVVEDFANQVRVEYQLGDRTSFLDKYSDVTMNMDQEYMAVTDYDQAALDLYEHIKDEDPNYLDPILYNEFRSCWDTGDVLNNRSEEENVNNQLTMMDNFISAYRNIDTEDNVLDYDTFTSYMLRVVEKNYGLDKDTLDGIKDRMTISKSMSDDGSIIEIPSITNKKDLKLLVDSYNEVGIRMEKSSLRNIDSERGSR